MTILKIAERINSSTFKTYPYLTISRVVALQGIHISLFNLHNKHTVLYVEHNAEQG